MGSATWIDVTPKWWNSLDGRGCRNGSAVVASVLLDCVDAMRLSGGKLGGAMSAAYAMSHGGPAIELCFADADGLRLEPLRAAILDRFDSPDVRRAAELAVEARRQRQAVIAGQVSR